MEIFSIVTYAEVHCNKKSKGNQMLKENIMGG
jgi:hypothetical protein